ncbi:MAG TPA: excinuclease ABC subunit UvrC [Clostridia bacterium]|jgi:excinuclease ABC subunit C|nr:excinuclease ABC subunit UvrC [Clostridia bacterium]
MEQNNNLIENKLKLLPTSSGVYLMLDENKKIIYIGKAKNLKNRVKQYFNNSDKNAKTASLVSQIRDFEYIITPTELEALVLENNLIKLHKPYYNILLKDDKTYPYIKINIEETYPTIEIVRKVKKGGKYFGPYLLGVSSQKLLDLIHNLFPIRSCRGKNPRGKKVCLEYHLNRCLGPCVNNVTKQGYQKHIKDVIQLLSGDVSNAKNILTEKMQSAVEKEEFELAITYRDYLQLLDNLTRKQYINLPNVLNADVFTYVKDETYGCINILLVRSGNVIGSYNKPVLEAGEESDVLSSYIMQYYDINPIIAEKILLSKEFDFSVELESFLSEKKGSKVSISIPKIGNNKKLVDISLNNAKEYLQKSIAQIKNKDEMTKGAVLLLADILSLKKNLQRIECFDISNISGTNQVASMSVFINGEPFKKHYRMFKVKTVLKSDDYSSLREVISRRIAALSSDDVSFSSRPDLVIIDGGKGQLGAVYDLLQEEGLDVISLAEKEEHIFVPLEKTPIILNRDNPALKLCQRIRDEAHRFAINYHRVLREDSMFKSSLREIKGIGDKKAIALLEHFKTMDAIKTASVDELMEVPLITKENAESILKFFEGENI